MEVQIYLNCPNCDEEVSKCSYCKSKLRHDDYVKCLNGKHYCTIGEEKELEE